MRGLLALAFSAAVLPQSAVAQPAQGLSELAVELAYDYCLPCAQGRVRLDGPELKALGFSTSILKQSHPRAGQIEMVQLTRPDGTISFAVSSEATLCQVNVLGGKSAEAHANLRGSLSRLPYKFESDPAHSFSREGVQVESLNSRFIKAAGPGGDMAGFQIGVLERE